jgi:hypothetical protein
MKKVLVLVITFMVIGLTVVSAQDAAAIQKLTDDFISGRITLPEFERRMADVEKEYAQTEQRTQQVPQLQQQSQPQQQNNWPNRTVLNKYSLGSLTQPSGTIASFKENQPGQYRSTLLEIELSNARGHYDSVLAQVRQIPGILPSQSGLTLNDTTRFHLNKWFIAVSGDMANQYLAIIVEDRTLPAAPWAQ